MDVKCTVKNNNAEIGDPLRDIEICSMFAEGNMAEIKAVLIDEMVSALEKCKLNCFGR